MAIYGRGQMLGSGINPESFKQDYSGFADAAKMQSQGIASLGQSIGGVIEDYGKMKKEQKKIDALNKSSAKAIEAAITLGDSYGIQGAKDALSPFLSALNDPSLNAIEKAAMLEEGKAMIPTVFGRFDQSQQIAMDQARINAAGAGSGRSANLKLGEVNMVVGDQTYKIPVTFDPSTGETTDLDGNPIRSYFDQSEQIQSALGLPPVGGDVSGAITNTAGFDAPSLLPPPPVDDGTLIQNAVLIPGSNASFDGIIPMAINEPLGVPTPTGQPTAASMPAPQAGARRLPPGAVPVGKQDDIDEMKIIDANMVKRMGLDPNKVYIAKFRGDKMISAPELPGQDNKGRMFRMNPDTGAVEYIEGVSAMDLNKPPTTNLKEGQALVPDPTSSTGTKIVEIKSEVKEKALNDFSNYITQIGDSYAKLNQMGKAVSGGEANPLNYAFSTPLGQTMGRIFGEEGQPLRDQINTMVPNIINVIRQSSQMGAKGMDSEKELSFYLRSVGDATLPLEANIKALDALDKAYGKGNAVENMLKNYPELAQKVNKYNLAPPKTEAGATGGLLTPEDQSLIDKYKK